MTASSVGALARSIREYEAGGYPVDAVVPAMCVCGGDRFAVLYEDTVGVAARVCVACGEEVGMLDSDDHVDDVDEVEPAVCRCGGEEFRVAVGFALDSAGEVRWVSVGLECARDAVAGVYVDWKIDYLPSRHLLAAV